MYDPNEWAKRKRSGNRLAIVIGLLSICGGGVALALGWDVIRDQRQGPVSLTAADLAAAPDLKALPGNWATVNPTKVRDTGVRCDRWVDDGSVLPRRGCISKPAGSRSAPFGFPVFTPKGLHLTARGRAAHPGSPER